MTTEQKTALHIVIVNYKSSDYLAGCLAEIPSELDNLAISVSVVDNNSGENAELEALKKKYDWINFILNHKNLGFSKACNQGIKDGDAALYLLLNPDTVINRKSLEECIRFLRFTPEAGMVGCRILNPDGSSQKAGYRNIPTPSSAFLHFTGLQRILGNKGRVKPYNPPVPSGDKPTEVEAVSGSFLMFKKEVGELTGNLDEKFFMYGEDLDFCYRARLAGWKIYYLPAASILHYKRISSSRSATSANLHFFQAMEIFYRKHYYQDSGWVCRSAVLSGIWILKAASRIRFRLTKNRKVGSRG